MAKEMTAEIVKSGAAMGVVIPFGPRRAAAPKLLPAPEELRAEINRHRAEYEKARWNEAIALAWSMAKTDAKGSGLEPHVWRVLMALLRAALEQGARATEAPPSTSVLMTKYTPFTPSQWSDAIAKIRGARFAGLGVRSAPYAWAALWIVALVEEGRDVWKG
jgi:hypothetical protein